MFTTVVCSNNRPSLRSEVAGDISLLVSNGNRNLFVGSSTHPGVHVPEPSSTATGTLILESSISPTPSVKLASALSAAAALAQSSVQIVTANTTIESIVGL